MRIARPFPGRRHPDFHAAQVLNTLFGGFFGSAEKVSRSMLALADSGVSRIQVSPFSDSAFPTLASHLF